MKEKFRYLVVSTAGGVETFHYAQSVEITANACLVMKEYVLTTSKGNQKAAHPTTFSPGLWILIDRQKDPIEVEYK